MKSGRSSHHLCLNSPLVALILSTVFLWPSSIARADTTICGPIAGGTWTPDGNNYVVTCNATVNSEATLTIQPGVVVKLDPNTSLRIDGTLVAHGCTFTSNNAVPTKGDWGRISFSTTSVDATFDAGSNYLSGSIIQGCTLEWGGGGTGIRAMLETNLASPFIDGNMIQNSATSGIYALGRSNSIPVTIRQNEISSNEGYYVDGAGIFVSSGEVTGNTISNNGRTLSGLGGGIYATASTISDNIISANQSAPWAAEPLGGGIYASASTLTGNTVIGNVGGGLFATSSTIRENQIADNSAFVTYNVVCGGLTVDGNSIVAANTISRNVGQSRAGGGICATGGAVSGNTVTGNTSASDGGGIRASAADVVDNIVTDNTAVNGGGIHASAFSNLRDNTVTNNHATNQGGGVYVMNGITATNNQVSNNSAARGGGLFAEGDGVQINSIAANTVLDNEANFGGGIYAVLTTVRGNTVSGNHAQSDGGGIYTEGGTVRENTVSLNTVPSFGHGAGAYLVGETEFTYNDVVTNTASGGTAGGVTIDGQPQIRYNSLYGNQPYDAEVVSSQAVSGTLNYWGPVPCTQIPASIYDGRDAPGRGNLDYAPSLYTPVPLAQLAVPTELTYAVTGSTVALDWPPIPPIPNVGCRVPGSSAPDLGYYLYYDTYSSCAPFDGKGLKGGNSPIDIGTPTTINLNGVPPGRYYFLVTAYDYLERESSFSNAVAVDVGLGGVYVPLIVAP